MLDLSRNPGMYDIVHNNSLHHLPVAMAEAHRAPVRHDPAHAAGSLARVGRRTGVAEPRVRVGESTHGECVAPRRRGTVIHNGVDTDAWMPGPGGPAAIWFGRLVPEKAPHLAIRAARAAGMELDLAGPSLDRAYFDAEIAPLLDDRTRYLGHLRHEQLVRAVGRAAVSVVTPIWDEPYGLVAAESLACGTPVAAFARGGVPEILDELSGRLAAPGDVEALGAAMMAASGSRARMRGDVPSWPARSTAWSTTTRISTTRC